MCWLYFDVRARTGFHRHFYIYILMFDCTISEFIVKRVYFIIPCTGLFESTFTLLLTGRCCLHMLSYSVHNTLFITTDVYVFDSVLENSVIWIREKNEGRC